MRARRNDGGRSSLSWTNKIGEEMVEVSGLNPHVFTKEFKEK